MPYRASGRRLSRGSRHFWLMTMPEFELGQPIVGYASDAVAAVASADHTDLQGLAGLPLLRLAEYGGDVSSFWLRAVKSKV